MTILSLRRQSDLIIWLCMFPSFFCLFWDRCFMCKPQKILQHSSSHNGKHHHTAASCWPDEVVTFMPPTLSFLFSRAIARTQLPLFSRCYCEHSSEWYLVISTCSVDADFRGKLRSLRTSWIHSLKGSAVKHSFSLHFIQAPVSSSEESICICIQIKIYTFIYWKLN